MHVLIGKILSMIVRNSGGGGMEGGKAEREWLGKEMAGMWVCVGEGGGRGMGRLVIDLTLLPTNMGNDVCTLSF